MVAPFRAYSVSDELVNEGLTETRPRSDDRPNFVDSDRKGDEAVTVVRVVADIGESTIQFCPCVLIPAPHPPAEKSK